MLLFLCTLLLYPLGCLCDSQYVNTFIGTFGQGWGIGETVPGACRPFGFARVSPDTWQSDLPIPTDWEHNGGYYYGDDYINCFSHTHMAGAGVADYGTVGIMPVSVSSPTHYDTWDYAFRSYFSHSNESASPGYYSVLLMDHQINVEITATENTGVHKYTWVHPNSEKGVFFPASHSLYNRFPDGCQGANVTVDIANQEVRGWTSTRGWMSENLPNGHYASYFVARFNIPFISGGVWKGDQTYPCTNKNVSAVDPGIVPNPNGVGGFVGFGTQDTAIEVYVGISSIGFEQARRNLEVQVNGRKFDAILAETQSIWDGLLSKAKVEPTDNGEDLIKFWTAFYRVLTVPSAFSEADGKYKGFDLKTHTVDSKHKHFFTDLSLWDVYRTQFPWLTLFHPEVIEDVVYSLTEMYKEGGSLPRWPMAYGYGGSMIGEHAITVISEAYQKGITMDVNASYAACKYAFTNQQVHAGFDVSAWVKYKYMPSDIDWRGACITLELAYDAWSLSTFAKEIGELADAATFAAQSTYFQNVWNTEEKFFCPKRTNGSWDCPEIYIDIFDSRYVEGDAWHYRFYVPPGHVPTLIELFGGNETFVEQLSEFMSRAEYDPITAVANPYYWAGNEHNLMAPFLFNYAGRLDLTSQYVKWVRDNLYTGAPDGLPGNDDYGAISAWYLWTALGLYPVSGSTKFFLVIPAFPDIQIELPNNKLLHVKVHNFASWKSDITKVSINGRGIDLLNPFVEWEDLIGSPVCLLEFWQ